MARIARLVVPNYPHHITQRGNRRQPVFFSDDDYRAYIELLSEAREKADVEVWAYCFMPNQCCRWCLTGKNTCVAGMMRIRKIAFDCTAERDAR